MPSTTLTVSEEMLVNVNTNYSEPAVAALGVNSGKLFTCEGGLLFFRCRGGCVQINEDDLTPFTEDDMENLWDFPFFEHCNVREGDLEVNVKFAV